MADNAESGEIKTQKARNGWNPSRGFWIGMAGVAIFAGVLAIAGAYASTTEPATQGLQEPVEPAPTVIVSHAPRKTTPPDDLAFNAAVPGVASAPSDPAGALLDSSAGPAGTDEPAVTGDAHSSSSVMSPTPVASSWSQSPVFVPPAPAAALGPSAQSLVGYANETLGIEIATEGQDWGDTDLEQAENIGAVVSAWQRLPLQVTSSIVDHPHGTLQVLSNQQGRTSGGWQPYGDVATSFYTNSDQGVEGYRVSHQVVLATGADEETVLHELLHAYALRNVAADEYVAAFIDDEMQSFMAATGWAMLVSGAELIENAHQPWHVVNGLFAYVGTGADAANPLEAFASAGAAHYAGNACDCPESAWFEENLG